MSRWRSWVRARTIAACYGALKLYTRYVPFHRGRGAFIRPIQFLTNRGWPPPLTPIADGLTMEFEPSLLGWTIFEKGAWEPEQTALFLSIFT